MTPIEKDLITKLENKIKAVALLVSDSKILESDAWVELNQVLNMLIIECEDEVERCEDCEGLGRIKEIECKNCNGKGYNFY